MKTSKTIISYALKRLNKINTGYSIYEKLCHQLIAKVIDIEFISSSGLDTGGDGGVDGWSIDENGEKTKYTFSIQQDYKTKIKKEIEKTDSEHYAKVRFFSNQSIKQKEKEDFYKKYSDFDLIIYDKENLVDFIEKNEELGSLIGLPKILAEVNIDYIRKHNQLHNKKETIKSYIPRSISYFDDRENRWIKNTLTEFINVCSSFTLIQAPAGFGKSCLVKQLYLELLNEDSNNILPPAIIEFKMP